MTEYECWHACLERNTGKWSTKVEAAFGHARGLPFDVWWEEVRNNFKQQDRYTLQVLNSAEDFDFWSQGSDEVAVLINLHTPKVQLMKALQELLDQVHPSKRGRPERDQFSDYTVKGHPNMAALTKALEVWDTVKANPSMKLWEVGVRCKVNLNMIPTKGDPTTGQRKVLVPTVARYLDRAQRMIDGVAEGVFPA